MHHPVLKIHTIIPIWVIPNIGLTSELYMYVWFGKYVIMDNIALTSTLRIVFNAIRIFHHYSHFTWCSFIDFIILDRAQTFQTAWRKRFFIHANESIKVHSYIGYNLRFLCSLHFSDWLTTWWIEFLLLKLEQDLTPVLSKLTVQLLINVASWSYW